MLKSKTIVSPSRKKFDEELTEFIKDKEDRIDKLMFAATSPSDYTSITYVMVVIYHTEEGEEKEESADDDEDED